MNAPKKIYLFENPILDFSKLSQRQSKDDIEYIRTDVFIEKACEWLNKNTGFFSEKEFKKAMKGE